MISRFMARLLTLSAGAVLLAVLPAAAATITFVSAQQQGSLKQGEPLTECNFRLEGAITPGDAEHFEALLQTHASAFQSDWPIAVLCLNSQGGVLTEGIRIAENLRRDRPDPKKDGIPMVVTRLEAGATCVSSCAVIFMAGTRDYWEGDPVPARSMHPTAKLGFHAPALRVGEGQYEKSHVDRAFMVSVTAIAEILRVLNVGQTPDGTLYGGVGPWLHGTLVEAMLRTPAESMRFIETVDDAGRWGIDVFPIAQRNLTYKTGYQACINRFYWRSGQSAKGAYELQWGDEATHFVGEDRGTGADRVLMFALDQMVGTGCEIRLGNDGTMFMEAFIPDMGVEQGVSFDYSQTGTPSRMDVGAEALWFFPAETPLPALGSQGLRTSEPSAAALVDWAPRFGGDKVSLWTHNGSLMAWESKGAQRWIWYFRPRDGLAAHGVVPGTLLFEGQLTSGTLTGTARRFSKQCGNLEYEVSGQPEGTRVVMAGTYPAYDDSCKTAGSRTDQLVFEYKAKSP